MKFPGRYLSVLSGYFYACVLCLHSFLVINGPLEYDSCTPSMNTFSRLLCGEIELLAADLHTGVAPFLLFPA